jgi:ATP-dependent DNA helicase PIF1
MFRKIKYSKAISRWKNTDVLVIDETSMLHYHFFDSLEYAARKIRGNPFPFGGIQIIAVGDFNQLQPVVSKDEAALHDLYKLCIFSPSWKRTFQEVVKLTVNVRQQDDPIYCKMLREIARGEVTQDTVDRLRSRKGVVLVPRKGVTPVTLVSRNEDAKAINESTLADLDSEKRVYTWVHSASNVTPTEETALKEKMMKSVTVSETLTLKVGAKVMLVANLSVENKLVNGTQGIVLAFDSKDGLPIVQFDNQKDTTKVHIYDWRQCINRGPNEDVGVVSLKALPLVLAWAITIHKSQAITLEQGYVDIGRKIFMPSQAYVALSRFKRLEDVSLIDFDPASIRVEPEVVEYYNQMEAADERILEDDEDTDIVISTYALSTIIRPEQAKKYVDPSVFNRSTSNSPGNQKSDLMRKLRMAHAQSKRF